jgi:hypothetical protein
VLIQSVPLPPKSPRLVDRIYFVSFLVLAAKIMKISVLWDVSLCTLVDTDLCFIGVYFLNRHADCPDDGGSKILRNVGQYLADNTARRPRRQQYSECSLVFYLTALCELQSVVSVNVTSIRKKNITVSTNNF